ncbi:MAG: serine/threonine-protein kinase [Planctomycetota bacterium]
MTNCADRDAEIERQVGMWLALAETGRAPTPESFAAQLLEPIRFAVVARLRDLEEVSSIFADLRAARGGTVARFRLPIVDPVLATDPEPMLEPLNGSIAPLPPTTKNGTHLHESPRSLSQSQPSPAPRPLPTSVTETTTTTAAEAAEIAPVHAPPILPTFDPKPRVAGFRIESRIGAGSVGVVYAATDLTLNRRVALKVLKRGTSAERRSAILDEARKLAALRHPGVVTVYSVVEDVDSPAIVMEFVAGPRLDELPVRPSYNERARLLKGIAEALAAAHARGIIHRDLKPQNIRVSADLEPRLLDFGLAIGPGDALRGGDFNGTPIYASPEQVRGEPLSPAADVFSFGSVCYWLLCGRAPFAASTLPEVFDRVQNSEPAFPRAIASDVPKELQAICLACLARAPADRPTAVEVAAELERYLRGVPIRLRPRCYSDLLRRKLGEQDQAVEDWSAQGLIAPIDRDRLQTVYRRLLSDEDQWIFDPRRLTFIQLALYMSSWLVVVAAALLVWLARDDLGAPWRWILPLGASGTLLCCGVVGYRRREFFASAAFLAAGVLSIAPALLAVFAEHSMFAWRAADVQQLLPAPFGNEQVMVAVCSALIVSLIAQRRMGLTGFAWTSALLMTASYLAVLINFNWLGRPAHAQALACLPLVALVAMGLRYERRGLVRWATPFHWLGFAAFIIAADVYAISRPTLELFGVTPAATAEGYWTQHRIESFSLALNGLLLGAVMALIERARSLDLRRAGRVLEVLVPIHLLGPIVVIAAGEATTAKSAIDMTCYLLAVGLLLALSPWRAHYRFLVAGLGGLALGSYLLIDLELVARGPFVIVLGSVALAAALFSYAWATARAKSRAAT